MSAAGILIAEYESSVAQDLKARVEALGYRVIDIASSGEEAIEMSEKLRPNIVLMNSRLRGTIDGVQTGRPGHTDRLHGGLRESGDDPARRKHCTVRIYLSPI